LGSHPQSLAATASPAAVRHPLLRPLLHRLLLSRAACRGSKTASAYYANEEPYTVGFATHYATLQLLRGHLLQRLNPNLAQ
jgi:hypothetical protein